MKAIQTRDIPASNSKPARVKAFDADGNSVTIARLQHCVIDRTHAAAAEALKSKMGWTGTFVQGSIKGGQVFVFLPE